MPYLQFTSCGIMWTLIILPPQMAERLRRAQPVSVTNHVKARQSLIERAVITWLATESGWARRKRSAICSGKLCGGFIIFSSSAAPVAGIWNVAIFCSCDLDLNPMTFVYELYPYPVKLYRQTKDELSTSRLSKVVIITDRQRDVTENTSTPLRWWWHS